MIKPYQASQSPGISFRARQTQLTNIRIFFPVFSLENLRHLQLALLVLVVPIIINLVGCILTGSFQTSQDCTLVEVLEQEKEGSRVGA